MEQEMIKILQKDIEIPKAVQERAENAFAKIYARSRGKSGENEEERERREETGYGRDHYDSGFQVPQVQGRKGTEGQGKRIIYEIR